MADFIEAQAAVDFEQFPHTFVDPVTAKKRKKDAEEERKQQERVTPAQMKAADKLAKQVVQKQTEEEEAEEKRRIVREVQRYVDEFPDRIKTKLPRSFGTKMSLADLRDVQDAVQLELNSTGGTTQVAMLYTAVVGFMQDMSYLTPIKLAGPKADLRHTLAANQAEWVPLIKEFAIKYERWFAAGVERRLIFFTARMCMMVHNANVMPDVDTSAPATPEQASELDDILGS